MAENEEETGYNGRFPPKVNYMVSLKVTNLTHRMTSTSEKLRQVFEQYGDVGDVYIPRNRGWNWRTRDCVRYAFVRFYDEKDAEKAMDSLDGHYLDGKQIRVEIAGFRRDGVASQNSRSQSSSAASSTVYRRRDRSGSHKEQSRSRSRTRTAPESRYHLENSRSKSKSPEHKRATSRLGSPKEKSRSRSRTRSEKSQTASASGYRENSRSKSQESRRSKSKSPSERSRATTSRSSGQMQSQSLNCGSGQQTQLFNGPQDNGPQDNNTESEQESGYYPEEGSSENTSSQPSQLGHIEERVPEIVLTGCYSLTTTLLDSDKIWIKKFLRCEYCQKHILVSPFFCEQNGHTVCNHCVTLLISTDKDGISKCPVATTDSSGIGVFKMCGSLVQRNLSKQIEELVTGYQVSCPNFECNAVLCAKDLTEHMDNCDKGEEIIECKFSSCVDKVLHISDYPTHLYLHHGISLDINMLSELQINVQYLKESLENSSGCEVIALLSCHDQKFVIVKSEIKSNLILFAYIIHKDASIAAQFQMTIDIQIKGSSLLHYEGEVHPISVSVSDLILLGKYNVIQKEPLHISLMKKSADTHYWHFGIGIKYRDLNMEQ